MPNNIPFSPQCDILGGQRNILHVAQELSECAKQNQCFYTVPTVVMNLPSGVPFDIYQRLLKYGELLPITSFLFLIERCLATED